MKNTPLPYELLDSGHGRKLEQVGPFRLVRPALNAFWRPSLPEDTWKSADAVFIRDSSGSGRWEYRRRLPETWEAAWGGFTMLVKPTGFGHLGFFAEQYENWDMFAAMVPKLGESPRALNLFAYSGLGSMAFARAGAETCHLDAARGMIDWGREMHALNPHVPNQIRWIADDVLKFCNRELRRGAQYQAIALDPPTFGRGAAGQVWKIEDDLPELLLLCRRLVDVRRPFFITLSGHSPGFTPLVQERLLAEAFGASGRMESREMTIPENSGRKLPAGITTTYFSGL